MERGWRISGSHATCFTSRPAATFMGVIASCCENPPAVAAKLENENMPIQMTARTLRRFAFSSFDGREFGIQQSDGFDLLNLGPISQWPRPFCLIPETVTR